MSGSVSSKELQNYLAALVNKLVTENPALKKPPNSIDKMIDDATALLRHKEQEQGQGLSMEKMTDPEFVKQLIVTMTTMATITNSEEITKHLELLTKALKQYKKSNEYHHELKSLLGDENELLAALMELLNEIDLIADLPVHQREKLKDKLRKKLKNRLRSKAFNKLEGLLNMYFIPQSKDTIKGALQKMIAAIKGNLDKLNKNPDKQSSASNDLYVNLFGILSSYITGSHMVPMQQYIGNGFGFTDWNPYHGSANIDSINEINLQFGDSLGIEARTIQNYFKVEDGTVNEFVDLLRSEGISVAQQVSAPEVRRTPPKK